MKMSLKKAKYKFYFIYYLIKLINYQVIYNFDFIKKKKKAEN
jgi:hypothetical protein